MGGGYFGLFQWEKIIFCQNGQGEFPKEQSLVEDKPESGTQKYSKCQTPPHMKKNKLLLNEYLGDFMHFETIFFFCGK